MENLIPLECISGLSFQVYFKEEILKLSVLEITNLEVLDVLGNASKDGLYDLRLGPNDKNDVCETCGLDFMACAGHPGHITLPVPVYNPVFFQHVYQLLRGTCFHCHKLDAPSLNLYLVLYQLQVLDYGLVSAAQELAELAAFIDDDDDLEAKIAKLEVKFQEVMKSVTPGQNDVPLKSVVECRKKIVKNFVRDHLMKDKNKCPHCKNTKLKITKQDRRLVFKNAASKAKRSRKSTSAADESAVAEDEPQTELSHRELTAEEAKKHLQQMWENDKVFLQQIFKTLVKKAPTESSPIDMFFMTHLIVPSNRFRRIHCLKGRKFADAQTIVFLEILKDCELMNKVLRKLGHAEISDVDLQRINKIPAETDGEKFSLMYQQLQRHVIELYDSDIDTDRNKVSRGIKQILEKKEGLFRMNMMGKRVNFAARSVISPDPNIMVNEIGIPLVFAKKLTFPEPVNYWNIESMRHAVKNGPNIHPGAWYVEMEDGRRVILNKDDPAQRQAIANTLLTPPASTQNVVGGVKIVHRHLKNGDMLLINRQPTLHKPSIMAHKAKVLPGEKTVRLHYSNCKSYNADFDGDEMNCHLPQSYEGQGESRYIVNVNHQYLVPKDGTPLGGLIQDHIIAGVLITTRGRFFAKENYQQLIYSAMSFNKKRLKLLPPAILKPKNLWSGKQIVSTIIINLIPEGKIALTVEGKAKVSSKTWKNAPAREWCAGGTPLAGDSMTESEVIIREGELLCGVIDKAQIGPTPYSLIHMCYELYGGEISNTILTALARLFQHFLQYHHGFSLGIEDIVVTNKANRKRRKILKTAKREGLAATANALEVGNVENFTEAELLSKYKQTHFNRDDFGLKMLDVEMKKVTHSLNNQINEVCIPNGLRKKFPSNNLQLMVVSGAKGSSVNAMQISCLLGQIELEGRRMPLMLNGSTLPSFEPYDTSPQAGGFVGGRFLTGINPQEYFFHCMAGREGLIDTAVKTSRSGYLQRCLIKHLEGITVNYDLTVRDSDGTVLQFYYGEDGLDPTKMQLLKENRLHLLATNHRAAINKTDIEILKDRVEVNLKKEKKWIKKWKKSHKSDFEGRISALPHYKRDCSLDSKAQIEMIRESRDNLDEDTKIELEKLTKKCPNPVNSKHRSDLTFGAVSEKMDMLIDDYVEKNPYHLLWKEKSSGNKLSEKDFRDLCHYRYMRSLAEPGEAVGLLAAQSVGEPSTQMTLNTFHFAGKGEMNVTLGIPRIREILMVASKNIATPTMDLPFLDIPGIEQKAEKLRQKMSVVSLKDMLERIHIKEYVSIGDSTHTRNYNIHMKFLKHSEYKGYVNTSPAKILYYIENKFIEQFIDALKKKLKKSSKSRVVDIVTDGGNFGRSKTLERAEVDDDDDSGGGGDGGDDDVDSPPVHIQTDGNEDGGDSSAESEGEGDTTTTKSKMRRDQELGYEDPEDEDILPEDEDMLAESENESSDENKNVKEEIKDDEAGEEKSDFFILKKIKSKKSITDEDKETRINNVKDNNYVSSYNFDTLKERWCEITLQLELNSNKIDMKSLLEEVVSKADIHSVPRIKEAILVKTDGKNGSNLMLKTNGANFLEAFKYVDLLDINKIYSNNIAEIEQIYGIEAAACAIRKEIVNVFAAYGIEVDPRHLSLISDYMTCSGHYRPCNRIGMDGNASPLQQITFETSNKFLVESMIMGVEDRLKSPSANIVVGQLFRGGTGSFDFLMDAGAN